MRREHEGCLKPELLRGAAIGCDDRVVLAGVSGVVHVSLIPYSLVDKSSTGISRRLVDSNG